MAFTFDPPRFLLYISIAILVANIAILVLGRRHPTRKVLGLVVGAALVAVLLTRFHRIGASSLTIDDAGIVAATDGTARIPWSNVEKAAYVADLSTSRYRPTRPGPGATR
jgi:hypothetical protein